MRCLSTFSGCGWAYGLTFTLLPPQTLPEIWESWLKSYLMPVYNPGSEAVEPCKLHPMSMSYIYEVFDHLLRLWMGIWLHNHTITTTDTSPDLWELAEIIAELSVQTMPLLFHWGCRTFQTACHVHVIHIWGVWVPSQVVGGHMASHPHCYYQGSFPRLRKVSEIEPHASVQTMQLQFDGGCRTFQLYLSSMSYIHKGLECFLRLSMGIWLHTHIITTTDASPDLGNLAEIVSDVSVQTKPLRFGWGCRIFLPISHVHGIHIWEDWAPYQVVDWHMA